MNDRDKAAGLAKKWEAEEQGAMTSRLTGGDAIQSAAELRVHITEVATIAANIKISAANNPIASAQAGKITEQINAALKKLGQIDSHLQSKARQAKAAEEMAAGGGQVVTDHLTALIDLLPNSRHSILTYIENNFSGFNYTVGSIGHKPSLSSPTIDEIGTHALHSSIKHNDQEVFLALYSKAGWPDIATSITELFELAGYYSPNGKDAPYKRDKILPILIHENILGSLPAETINKIFAGIAGVSTDASTIIPAFVANLGDKSSELDLANSLYKALWNEGTYSAGVPKNVDAFLELLKGKQDIIDAGLALIATKKSRKDREGLPDSPDHLKINSRLIDLATKPIAKDIIIEIARTGYEETLKSALNHSALEELPEVLKSLSHPVIPVPENNVMCVIEKILDSDTKIPNDILFDCLVASIAKGQKEILGVLVDVVVKLPQEERLELINKTETNRRSPNKGGNILLYQAATFSRNTSHSDAQKSDDVNTAITLTYKLSNAGANLLAPNDDGKTAVDILNTRVEGKGKELVNSQALRLLNSQFNTLLRAQEEAFVRLTTNHVDKTGQVPMLMGTGGMGGLGGLLALQGSPSSSQQPPTHRLGSGTSPSPNVGRGDVVEAEEVDIIFPGK